jgi:hypothetical protein
MRQCGSLLLATLMGLLCVHGADAKEKQVVTVSYVLAPAQPPPANIKTVAVINSRVDSIDGVKGNSRELKWSKIAADMIESMLNSGGEQQISVVQRSATKHILAEQDLQLVGIVEGDAATRAGRVLAADGLIMSKIRINIDVQRSRKSSVDWGGFFGSAMGGPPPQARAVRYHRTPDGRVVAHESARPAVPTREIEEISRDMTVQCTFMLVDAVTGKSVVQFSPPVYQKKDKKSPDFVFGHNINEADLDPVDHFIGELVEHAARDFVSMLAPVQVSYSYEVTGRGKQGEAAVRAMRSDDFPGAMQMWEAAFKSDPKEPDTVFGMGITSELLGDFPRALQFYRQVLGMKGVDKDNIPIYTDAKNRLSAHMNRIVRKNPNGG